MTEQRRESARQLDAIDLKVIELFATVCEDLPGVTEALLSGLAKVNDEMHALHTSLVAELASGRMASLVTIEMALVARFYERLGDHAVNIVRRVCYLAGRTADTSA